MGSTVHAKGDSSHLGFTRVEFFVVLIVIGLLVAMLLPATRGSREAARRMQCSNHLKQIGLALQNYHDVFQSLPYGARARCVSTGSENTCGDSKMRQGWGPSWVMGLLPFTMANMLPDLLEAAAQGNPDAWATDVTTQAPGRAGFHIHNQKIGWLLCPSSPLPQVENLRGSTFPTSIVPSYVGISGATNHGANQLSGEIPFLENRLKPGPVPTDHAANANGGADPTGSQQSWGGMLTVNECYGLTAVKDGTSNTMVVAERSDYFFSQHTRGNSGTRLRIDGSFGNGGTGPMTGGWWWLGTDNGYTSQHGSTEWTYAYNVTTVRAYSPPAPKNAMVGFNGKYANFPLGTSPSSTTSVQGIGQMQQNNPLISSHPNVVLAMFMDGHTAAITKNTPAVIVKRLATRDDGQEIAPY
jgi:type II secretory pathway pseudopilin PulG